MYKNRLLEKAFLAKVFGQDWCSSDTRSRCTTLLMHAISDVEEKYGSHAMYRWFYHEHTFFANFHFPVAVADRYTSSSVGWNYLSGHVSGIIYYQRQFTSAINRGDTRTKPKNQEPEKSKLRMANVTLRSRSKRLSYEKYTRKCSNARLFSALKEKCI